MNNQEQLNSINQKLREDNATVWDLSEYELAWLIEQAEDSQMAIKRVDEIGKLALNRERDYKNLEKDYRSCNYLKKQYHDEMIRLQEEKWLAEEECERYKKMFSKEKGKNIELEVKIRSLRLQIGWEIT